MSILEKLSTQVPRHKKMSPDNPVHRITKQYMEQIREAKERGYSWQQIYTAIKEDVGEEWQEEWRCYKIPEHYKMILREG